MDLNGGNGGGNVNLNGDMIPLGLLPAGVQIRRESQLQFPPELEAALRAARDASGGRYAIAVLTADESHDEVTLFFCRGSAWSDDRCFLKAYQLFVGEFLKITPERMNEIRRGPDVAAYASSQPPQSTFGPASPPESLI